MTEQIQNQPNRMPGKPGPERQAWALNEKPAEKIPASTEELVVPININIPRIPTSEPAKGQAEQSVAGELEKGNLGRIVAQAIIKDALNNPLKEKAAKPEAVTTKSTPEAAVATPSPKITAEKPPKKGLSKKQKTLAGIGAVLLGAAVGTAWGIHEATENNKGNDSLAVTGGIHTMQAGETYEVSANSIVNGDILAKVNGEWVRLYDNSPETGLQVKVLEDTEIKAPYGATVNTNLDPKMMDSILEQDRRATKRAHPEIEKIDVVILQRANPQGK